MDGRDAKRIAQEMHYDEIVYQLNTATLTGIYMNYYMNDTLNCDCLCRFMQLVNYL